jgi:hypothetical protein
MSGISKPLEKCHGRSRSDTTCASDVDATKSIARAHNNLQVYLAADKFGILRLKSLATKRFASWVSRNWRSTGFLEIVQVVTISTPPHDPGLRRIVVDAISENFGILVKEGDIMRVLEDYESLGSAVLVKLVQSGRMGNTNAKKSKKRLWGRYRGPEA